jgi:CDP-glucose 4,6-dehydratase
MKRDLSSAFSEKRVLITGHTGFKGSWLQTWLESLGAEVAGLSLDPLTEPSLSTLLSPQNSVYDARHDIRDFDFVSQFVSNFRPDFVFHLAAQAIVSKSFDQPRETFETNVIGTINILESLRHLDTPVVAVMVTSDKAYLNKEWTWGYRENDQLGGHDPYSGSKAATELALASYVNSFFASSSQVRIGIARAGNVIGGGDWSDDRIVPDAIRSWRSGQRLQVRSSQSTRPWQHVLEPLSGYLTLASRLYESPILSGEAFNFGPAHHEARSVLDLILAIRDHLGDLDYSVVSPPTHLKEAGLLQLNCDKAQSVLGWRSALTFDETARLTSEWYTDFYRDPSSAREITLAQISWYTELRNKKD